MQGPKPSYGQGVASQPSRGMCVVCGGCPRAARSPKLPGPAQNWPRALIWGRARAVLVGHAANLPPTVLRPCCLARAVVWCPCPPNRRLEAPKRPGRPKIACGHAFWAVHRLFLVGHTSSPPLAVLRPRCLARAAGWCPPHHNRAGAAPNRLGLPQLACGHPFGAMHGPFCPPPPPATWAHDTAACCATQHAHLLKAWPKSTVGVIKNYLATWCHVVGHKNMMNYLQCMAVAAVGPSQTAERPGLLPDVSAGKEVVNSNKCHACTTLTLWLL